MRNRIGRNYKKDVCNRCDCDLARKKKIFFSDDKSKPSLRKSRMLSFLNHGRVAATLLTATLARAFFLLVPLQSSAASLVKGC